MYFPDRDPAKLIAEARELLNEAEEVQRTQYPRRLESAVTLLAQAVDKLLALNEDR